MDGPTEKRAVEWSSLFASRERVHRRYENIWKLPLIKKRSQLLGRLLRDGITILDVGGGSRGAKEEIDRYSLNVTYQSMDVDRNVPHDYYSIEEIGSTFDLILLSEVLEHLSFNEGFVLLKKTRELLNDGGIIVVSTPNVFHPNKFFTTSDHRTFFAYDELAAVMELAGFRVTELHRVYNDAFHRYFLKVYLFNFLFRFLGIDYAHTVFAVGRRVDQR